MGKILSKRTHKKPSQTDTTLKVQHDQRGRLSYDEDMFTMRSERQEPVDQLQIPRRSQNDDFNINKDMRRSVLQERHEAGGQLRAPRHSYEDDEMDMAIRPRSILTIASTDSAYSDRSGARASSRAEEESILFQHMVEAFQPLIERSVKVMEVVPRLHFIDDIELFRSLDRDSPTKAVATLIEKIKESGDPGRWQTFMEALESCGYKYIVTLLKGKAEEDHTIQRKLLRLFTPNLIRRIDPQDFIDHLYSKDVIGDQDMEEIRCEQNNRGPIAASLMLLDRVPRKVPDWFEIFVEVLKECGLEDCVKDIENASSARRPSAVSVGFRDTARKEVVRDTGPAISQPRRYENLTDLKATVQDKTKQENVNQELLIQLKRSEEMVAKLDQRLMIEHEGLERLTRHIEHGQEQERHADTYTKGMASEEKLSKLENRLLHELNEIKRLTVDVGLLKRLKSDIESLKLDISIIKDDVAFLKQTTSRSNVLTNGKSHVYELTHF